MILQSFCLLFKSSGLHLFSSHVVVINPMQFSSRFNCIKRQPPAESALPTSHFLSYIRELPCLHLDAIKKCKRISTQLGTVGQRMLITINMVQFPFSPLDDRMPGTFHQPHQKPIRSNHWLIFSSDLVNSILFLWLLCSLFYWSLIPRIAFLKKLPAHQFFLHSEQTRLTQEPFFPAKASHRSLSGFIFSLIQY